MRPNEIRTVFNYYFWAFDRVWEILLHLANHGTDHRAQILAILHHHFHVKTIEQDMIYYLAERNRN